MPVNIGQVRALRGRLASELEAIDAMEAHAVLATLPNFPVHIETIREQLRATVSHITFVIEQYEME